MVISDILSLGSDPVRPAWTPVGVPEMESAALAALKHEGNALVAAGPGAGKTEFLAQRALYLLTSGKAENPKRILAISFKKQAAENLQRRVQARISEGHALRFDSATFDAFSKRLVDQFRPALKFPLERLRLGYEFSPRGFTEGHIASFLANQRAQAPLEFRSQVSSYRPQTFMRDCVAKWTLPLTSTTSEATTAHEYLARQWWIATTLRGEVPPQLDFIMLNRVADFLLRSQPRLLAALQATYSHVFVDEFQDTTEAQYGLLTSAFLDGQGEVTCVGDERQRIMGWAGAKERVFETFTGDFGAEVFHLLRNYRSRPELIRVQRSLEANAEKPLGDPDQNLHVGRYARAIGYSSRAKEYAGVCSIVSKLIHEQGVAPRDIAILARNRPNVWFDGFRSSSMCAHATTGVSASVKPNSFSN